jgi:hypothetical protein
MFEWMTGDVLFLHDAPVAIQVLYRVESPQWISMEYVNGGFDPGYQHFSPGSLLTFANTHAATEAASAAGKALRYSFGRLETGYKTLWCCAETMRRSG